MKTICSFNKRVYTKDQIGLDFALIFKEMYQSCFQLMQTKMFYQNIKL